MHGVAGFEAFLARGDRKNEVEIKLPLGPCTCDSFTTSFEQQKGEKRHTSMWENW